MDYNLIRSERRTVALELSPEGRLIVRAPRRMPARDIAAFIRRQSEWIRVNRARQEERRAAAEVVRLTPEVSRTLRDRARHELPPLVACWADVLGVRPAGITVTSAAKRWGSCGSNGRLCFSCRVMLLPPRCIEYIVVHELAHLRVRGHGADFYAPFARRVGGTDTHDA